MSSVTVAAAADKHTMESIFAKNGLESPEAVKAQVCGKFYETGAGIISNSVIVLYITASMLHLLVRLIMEICITPFLLPVYCLTSCLSALILYDYERMI